MSVYRLNCLKEGVERMEKKQKRLQTLLIKYQPIQCKWRRVEIIKQWLHNIKYNKRWLKGRVRSEENIIANVWNGRLRKPKN